MTSTPTRRQLLAGFGSALLVPRLLANEATQKPLRGAFPIMATPYTESKAVDYEDLAAEVEFMVRCGVQGMVWPQAASEFAQLTKEERLKGMKVLAKAAKGTKPALVLGVQGTNTEDMLEYARLAEELEPDALIAIPPSQGKSVDDFRAYYRALGQVARRPVFFQTTGGPKGIDPPVALIVELAREFPNFGYVKEELGLPRMIELAKYRPAIKAIFSGTGGWPYEMRLGFEGMMPGCPYSDIYAQLWTLREAGKLDKVRELFSKLSLMITLEPQIPGMRLYMMKKRGVFKTMVSRRTEFKPTPESIQEIDESFTVLKPYLKGQQPAPESIQEIDESFTVLKPYLKGQQPAPEPIQEIDESFMVVKPYLKGQQPAPESIQEIDESFTVLKLYLKGQQPAPESIQETDESFTVLKPYRKGQPPTPESIQEIDESFTVLKPYPKGQQPAPASIQEIDESFTVLKPHLKG